MKVAQIPRVLFLLVFVNLYSMVMKLFIISLGDFCITLRGMFLARLLFCFCIISKCTCPFYLLDENLSFFGALFVPLPTYAALSVRHGSPLG